MTTRPPYFPPVRVDATLYDLGHLDPVRFQVVSDKLRRAVTVRCRFTNHVFTRAHDPATDGANQAVIMDGVRPRVFCPARHRLTMLLPGAVLALREPRVYVHETTSRRNWLYMVTIGAPRVEAPFRDAEDPTSLRYQVFFTLRKATKGGGDREDLDMTVESAYAEDPTRPVQLLGRALFAGLATAAVEGRQLHTPPARKR